MANNTTELDVHAIGVWSLRIVLVIGAIVSGCLGRDEVSSGCVAALVVSFVLL